jgi:murein DD-endopeptidase MepM/ murein hydrolase activator NlpD
MWLRVLSLALLGAVVWANAEEASPPHADWAVRVQPLQLINGSPVLFSVKSPKKLASLTASWQGNKLVFTLNTRNRTWYALGGVALKTKPGLYTLKLVATSTQGAESTLERRFAVKTGKYRKIAIKVAKQYTEPSPEQVRKISEDKSLKQAAFSQSAPEREWSGNFVAPVGAPVSDSFGTQRTFNGQVQSTHQGLDFGAGAGTRVSAVNAGTVVLAGPLFFEGNCVVLDHGQGLQTLYMHLSEIAVKAGEHVTRGQDLGLVGGTGRATGPHLHLGVRWRGEYLNPATLLKLRLPKW